MRLYSVPISTNVERVTLALAHKGLAVEQVEVPYDDRSEILRISGQELVPVLVADGEVVSDSTAILEWLEERFPDPPLFPGRSRAPRGDDGLRRLVQPGLEARAERDRGRARERRPGRGARRPHAVELRGSLDVFEALLDGRDYLLGDRLSVADCAAFPFLKFGLLWTEDDPYVFHAVLRDHLSPDSHPRVAAWIRRVDERPRA